GGSESKRLDPADDQRRGDWATPTSEPMPRVSGGCHPRPQAPGRGRLHRCVGGGGGDGV
ncbi:MAG: hypothetical protein AVDCRST_MAG19-3624, partial [uncultured Thermomicrobiales bacterium]